MADGTAGAHWQVGLCPNPCCHKPVVRVIDKIAGALCIEVICRWCRNRCVLGADPDKPVRPQVIVIASMEAYRLYRDDARERDQRVAEAARKRR